MEFIVIELGVDSDSELLTYPIDTEVQLAIARQALVTYGVEFALVWVSPTDEFSPESYINGQVLFAAS